MALKYKPYDLGLDQPGKMYVTVNGLINRGWTQNLIERLLKEPCKTVKHPRWRIPASVWHVDRVYAAERLTEFRTNRRKTR